PEYICGLTGPRDEWALAPAAGHSPIPILYDYSATRDQSGILGSDQYPGSDPCGACPSGTAATLGFSDQYHSTSDIAQTGGERCSGGKVRDPIGERARRERYVGGAIEVTAGDKVGSLGVRAVDLMCGRANGLPRDIDGKREGRVADDVEHVCRPGYHP